MESSLMSTLLEAGVDELLLVVYLGFVAEFSACYISRSIFVTVGELFWTGAFGFGSLSELATYCSLCAKF